MKYLNLNGYEECPNSRGGETQIKTIVLQLSPPRKLQFGRKSKDCHPTVRYRKEIITEHTNKLGMICAQLRSAKCSYQIASCQ